MRWERGIWIPVILLALTASSLRGQAAAGWDEDRTLSPYFEIQGGVAGVDRLPLSETDVDVHISGVIAAVVVRQVYENRGRRPIHAKYVFPASTRAAVNGLRMRIGARVVEAVIREKERARAEYRKAKREGKNAALLEQVRPNVFDMRVANIMPGDRIEVELRYTELLVPEDGVYEFVYPTVVGPRYTGGSGPAAPRGPWTTAAYLREPAGSPQRFDLDVTITAGMPLRRVSVPTHAVRTRWEGRRRARVSLEDSERHGGNRDYILRYGMAGGDIASGLILHRGERENFFLLMVEPPARVTPDKIPAREYVFVMDVSGSMRGFPLETSKELLGHLVEGLRESDSFNVLLFAGGSRLFSPESLPATAENVARAHRFIDDQSGGGGTELPRALERALALPRSSAKARALVVVTDGYISAEAEAFRIVRERRGDASVFAFGIGSSVNRFLVEGLARAGMSEPFVVTEPGEAGRMADRFREYVSAPVLTGVRVDFGALDVYDAAPGAVPDVLAQRPVVVYGKFRGDAEGAITLHGRTGAGDFHRAFALDAATADGSNALRYLWARRRIAELSDPAFGGGEAKREEITRLGLEHSLLTRYTSFIAVDRIVRNPEGAGADVEQARPLPKGMKAIETAAAIEVAAEPELRVLLLAAAVAFLLVAGLGRRGASASRSRGAQRRRRSEARRG